MTSCCHPHQMPWSGATGAIARCKRVSTRCGRKNRSVRVLRWICGVKLKPKAVNKPLHYFILHELDKPGSSATVSENPRFIGKRYRYKERYVDRFLQQLCEARNGRYLTSFPTESSSSSPSGRCLSLPLSLTSGVLGLRGLERRARMGAHGQTAMH